MIPVAPDKALQLKSQLTLRVARGALSFVVMVINAHWRALWRMLTHFLRGDCKMPENKSGADALLKKIRTKRQELADYLAKNEPRHLRLINSSIVAGALAAALTAGPGIGGDGFINSVKGIVSLGIPIWQVLCLVATILSVAAVVINSMLKSHDLTSRITSARSCDAKLEGLETMLELEQINVEQATPLYTQYLTEITHV